jgi:signal transduction histidine kinase
LILTFKMRLLIILLLSVLSPVQAWSSNLLVQNTDSFPADKQAIININKNNQQAFHLYLTNAVTARKLAEEALVTSKKINYSAGIGQSLLNIGITYWSQSYYPISLFYLKSALPYLAHANQGLLSDCYRFMGRNYTDIKEYNTGLAYARKAEQLAGGDKLRLEEAISSYSYIYTRLHQYDKAIAFTLKALKLASAVDDRGDVGILYGRLCTDYIKQHQFNLANKYCDSAYNIGLAVNNKRLKANMLVNRSVILYNRQKYQDALKYAQKAVSLADSAGIIDIELNADKSFIRIYQDQGNAKQALFYSNKYMLLVDSVNSINRVKSAGLIQDYFKLNTRLQDMNLVEHDNRANSMLIRSQKTTITVLFVAMSVLLIALYTLYRYYKQKNELSKQLQEQHLTTLAKNELIEAQAQHLEGLNNLKDKLLAVIGHDLRGPIFNLRNVTDMFEEGHFSSDDLHQVMKSMNPVIKGAELTLSNLLEWAGSQIRGNNIETACVSLLPAIEEIEQSNKHLMDQKQITFINKIKMGDLVMVDDNHLKVILRNLVSNALKFTPNHGTISVEVHPKDDYLVVSIKDTGHGMSTEEIGKLLSVKTHFSKKGTAGEKGTGIGLLLCRELIELNGGELWLQSELEKGTVFHFTLPAC